MKVKITDYSRRSIYAYQLPVAKRIVKEMKTDYESTVEDEALSAARIAGAVNGDWPREVLRADAEIARNGYMAELGRYDYYGEGSGDLDIWVEGIVTTAKGIISVGAYLSDIWASTGDNAAELTPRMYIRRYLPAKEGALE